MYTGQLLTAPLLKSFMKEILTLYMLLMGMKMSLSMSMMKAV